MLATLPKNDDEKKSSKNFDEKMLTPLLKMLTKKCWQTSEKY
jgi:hypothetical protein